MGGIPITTNYMTTIKFMYAVSVLNNKPTSKLKRKPFEDSVLLNNI
jgi:hypothetical protein